MIRVVAVATILCVAILWGNSNSVHASNCNYIISNAPDEPISLHINISYNNGTTTTYLNAACCDYVFCNYTMTGNYTRNKTIQSGDYNTTLKEFFNCDMPNATYMLLIAHAPVENASSFSAVYVISSVLWINISFKPLSDTNYSGGYNNTTLAFVDLMQYFYPLVNVGIFLAIAFFIIIGFRKILAPLLE
ncbi:MAG: hypothetical protein QXQ54_08075 [Thermoplasmata archaeon]